MEQNLRQNNLRIIALTLLIGILYCLFMPVRASWDVGYWQVWTKWIHQYGFGYIYNAQTVTKELNYHPFFLYILWLFGKIFTAQELVVKYIWVLKMFILPFDLIGAVSAIWFLKPENRKPTYIFLFLANLGYLYNTILWEQCDAIFTTFVCLSVYFLSIKRNLLWASLFYVLALQSKMQAIIFLPILGLLVLLHFREWSKSDIRNSILGIILLNFLILLPFISTGSMPYLWKVYTGGMGFYTEISKGAYNIWTLMMGEKAQELHDTLTLGGISYHKYGLFVFCMASAIVLLPLLISVIRKWKNENHFTDNQVVILTCALIPMVFYFFNTQMHERYIHPMVLFWGIFALQSRKYFPFIFASLLYFLNLERVMKLFKLPNYETLIFEPRLIAAGYLILMLYGIYQLYRISQIHFNFKSWKQNFEAIIKV